MLVAIHEFLLGVGTDVFGFRFQCDSCQSGKTKFVLKGVSLKTAERTVHAFGCLLTGVWQRGFILSHQTIICPKCQEKLSGGTVRSVDFREEDENG